MIAARKFLFDVRFDGSSEQQTAAACAETAADTAMDEPRFTEADLERARISGEVEGRAQAARELAAAAERRAVDLLESIDRGLEHLRETRALAIDEAVRHATAVATAIARKMLPALYRRHAVTEVEHVIAETLALLVDPATIAIHVHPSLREEIAARLLGDGDSGRKARLDIIGDGSISEGDVRIDWSIGGAERCAAALWQEIDALIAKTLEACETASAACGARAVLPTLAVAAGPTGPASADTTSGLNTTSGPNPFCGETHA